MVYVLPPSLITGMAAATSGTRVFEVSMSGEDG
jgi:hypothetical protein